MEQRIGRIKRFGQRRDRVDMLNLLYHGTLQPTVDEKVYAKLSERMRNRFDIFGTLPDVIDDDWIEDGRGTRGSPAGIYGTAEACERLRPQVRRRCDPEGRALGALREGSRPPRRQAEAVTGVG